MAQVFITLTLFRFTPPCPVPPIGNPVDDDDDDDDDIDDDEDEEEEVSIKPQAFLLPMPFPLRKVKAPWECMTSKRAVASCFDNGKDCGEEEEEEEEEEEIDESVS